MKTFFIYPNWEKDSALQILPLVFRILRRNTTTRLLLPDAMRPFYSTTEAEFVPEEKAVSTANLAVVLGGDGTMLRLARAAAAQQLPMLGINMGHVGFMTELEPNELGRLQKLLTGTYTIDTRMMLHIQIMRDDKRLYEDDALNDVVVGRGEAFHMMRAQILADNETVTYVNGDGIIVCTPTGSTAYSLSAGGPVIEPGTDNLAVIPICAHALAAKSFVFASSRRITLLTKGDVLLSVDGRPGVSIHSGDRIEVTRSSLRTRLIRLKGNSFYTILHQKLS